MVDYLLEVIVLPVADVDRAKEPRLIGLPRGPAQAERFAKYDKAWLRAVRKQWTAPGSRPAGKFNAGQKIYAGWIAGAVREQGRAAHGR